MSWPSLPAEVRAMIFGHLATSKCRQYRPPVRYSSRSMRRRCPQSDYATINHEWQAYFEATNFKHLTLSQSDVPDFKEVVLKSHREILVRHIWLRIQLPEYGCDKFSLEESVEERTAHEIRFTTAIYNLLGHLSELNARYDHPGITLELSAHSPSDSEHYCQELRCTQNDTAWNVSEIRPPILKILNPHANVHGWNNGTRLSLVPKANVRAFGNPRGLGLDLESTGIDLESAGLPKGKLLPPASVVTELLIRLQFHRHFAVRKGLQEIVKSLPRLRNFKYECQQGVNAGPVTGQAYREREHLYLFIAVTRNRKSLRRVSIHEASNVTYCEVPSPIAPDPHAGRALGENSNQLRELYVSYMVDAKDFFHSFWPGTPSKETSPEWPRLKRLSLTTALLPTVYREGLLQAAAAAAEKMPLLRTMQLSGYDQANKFYYLVEEGRRHVIILPAGTARNTSAKTTQCWQRVAATRGSPYNLAVRELPADSVERSRLEKTISIEHRARTPTTRTQMRLSRKL